MTFFILADDNSIDAIDKSKIMMYGYKWKFFGLCVIFLVLVLLCVLTLGIGLLWLMPVIRVTFAKFYEEVKENLRSVEYIANQP